MIRSKKPVAAGPGRIDVKPTQIPESVTCSSVHIFELARTYRKAVAVALENNRRGENPGRPTTLHTDTSSRSKT